MQINRPCTFLRILGKWYKCTVSSSQATLWHIRTSVYGCLLPHLTRFTTSYCIRLNFQYHLYIYNQYPENPRKSDRSCLSGLQVQGTASSPSSTAIRKPYYQTKDCNKLLLSPQLTSRIKKQIYRKTPFLYQKLMASSANIVRNYLAERVGFEPTVPIVSEHTVSNGTPSATRTPLQRDY